MPKSTKKTEKKQCVTSKFDERKKWQTEYAKLVDGIKERGLSFSVEELAVADVSKYKELMSFADICYLKQSAIRLLKRRAKLWAEEMAIAELNEKHAIVRAGQTYILTEKEHPVFGGKDFDLESKQSFKMYYEDENIVCWDGKIKNKADVWLKSPQRRKYRNIVFDPKMTTEEAEKKGCYNYWQGFAKDSKKGDCSFYWDHMRENICANNYEAFEYLFKWCAYTFQYPDQVHSSIVLIGPQGVGKNSFVEPLGVLLGAHYVLLSNIGELTSNFNFHLKNAVLIHANEAFWGGHRKDVSTLKSMITEDMCLIEGKGKDRIMVRNYKHIILSSNEEWPVQLDPDDRRFFVLRVSAAHKEDHAYFKAIKDQLDNGGYEALLYDLLNADVSDFNPRKPPSSPFSFDLKMRGASSMQRYLYDMLLEDSLRLGDGEVIPKQDAFQYYKDWCIENGERVQNRSEFGSELKKFLPSVRNFRPSQYGQRVRSYKFPSLEKCREDFCKSFKETGWIWSDEKE